LGMAVFVGETPNIKPTSGRPFVDVGAAGAVAIVNRTNTATNNVAVQLPVLNAEPPWWANGGYPPWVVRCSYDGPGFGTPASITVTSITMPYGEGG